MCIKLDLIQLSPLLECDPTVCLPEKSKVTRGWLNFSRGDKPSGHTPTRVIIGILYRIFLHQTPSNRIPAALRQTPSDWIHVVLWQSPSDWIHAMFVVCWIKGSNYNWKHLRISLGFPRKWWTLLWDLMISGWPNEWINITWQCFIKSDSRYLYEYII